MKDKIIIVGVLDKLGSTNVSMAKSFIKLGCEVIPINYRTIIQNYEMETFRKFLLDSIITHNPVLTIFCKCNTVDPNIIKECNNITNTYLWNPDPIQTIENCPEVLEHAKNADFVSCTGGSVAQWFEQQGVNKCYHIFEGIDPDIYRPVEPIEAIKADISFIGTRTQLRDEYKKLLEDNGYNTKFYGPGFTQEVIGDAFAQVCSSSKYMLSLNTQNDIPDYFSDRVFRYLACGACVLHLDETGTMNNYFEDGKEIIYFTKKTELLQKLKELEQKIIPRTNGKDKVLSTYTWDHSVQKILDICRSNVKKKEFKPTIKKCVICNSDLPSKTYEFKDLIKCPKCNLYTKDHALSKETLMQGLKSFLLSACFDKIKREIRIAESNWQLDIIEKYVDIGKLYDVGSGPGFFLKPAKDRGWKVEGNDISKACVDWAKENLDIDINYGFLDDLKFESEYYDAFILWNTLEHTLDPRKILTICFNKLRENGIVHIRVPNKNDKELIDHYEDLHLYEFNNTNLPMLLESIGFEKEFVELNDWHMDLLYKKPSKSKITKGFININKPKPVVLNKLYDINDTNRPEIKDLFDKIDIFSKENDLIFSHMKWFEYAYCLLYSQHEKGKVLDVGSAKSVWPYYLSSLGYDVTSIDTEDSEYRENIGNNFNVKTITADLREYLPHLENKFDLISNLSVIEHIDNDTKTIQNLAKYLKSGGVMVISTDFYKHYIEYPDANRTIVTDRPKGSHCDSRVYTKETFMKRIIEPLELEGVYRIGKTDYDNVDITNPENLAVRNLYTFGIAIVKKI